VTKYVALIGYPLAHSISPLIQQAAFDYYELDIHYRAWEVASDELGARVDELRSIQSLGANVTVPYKERVLSLLDELDELASRIGAVNTVVNRDGKLVGYNTDALGFMRALRLDGMFEPRDKKAVVFGAGGVARAVSLALTEAGVSSLTIVNRTPERARGLVRALEPFHSKVTALGFGDEELPKALSGCELLINCTSVGMRGAPAEGRSPLEPHLIPREALVFDVVYNPPQTRLMEDARKVGARVLGGLPMLVYQGATSFELWTKKEAPVGIIMKAARRAM
jgi:shikimate dehydrogenase